MILKSAINCIAFFNKAKNDLIKRGVRYRMAYQTPLTIEEVIQDISKNKYILPSIQREYVWDAEQIETLFDSLMRGYPIGAFLFWEIRKDKLKDYVFYEFLKNYHETKATHNPKADLSYSDGATAVLDGQQRLTSLYIGLMGTYAYKLKYRAWADDRAYPVRKLYLNLLGEPKESGNKYEFKFLVPSEVKNTEDSYWFKVGDILDIDAGNLTQYVIDNIAFSNYTKEQTSIASATITQLHNVIKTERTIVYYKEESEELDKVLNIFIRVNSGGTILSYSDLLLSIATAQWEKYDAREEITEFVDAINSIGKGFNINKDFVLKTALVLTDFTDIAFKVDNFNKANMQKIEDKWETIKKAITQAVTLVSSFGFSRDTLRSNNALIPIAYYLMTIGLPTNYIDSSKTKADRQNIKKWLIRSLLKRAFSGQPDNVLRPIREIIKDNLDEGFPFEKILDRFRGTNKSITFTDDDIEDNHMNLSYGKADTLAVLMLLYPSFDFKNNYHVDHIYPRSKFTKGYLLKQGVKAEDLDDYMGFVNHISNLQLILAIPNEEKSDTDFDRWFNEQNPTDNDKTAYRKLHMMPDMPYDYKHFIEFTDERYEIMCNKLKKILL